MSDPQTSIASAPPDEAPAFRSLPTIGLFLGPVLAVIVYMALGQSAPDVSGTPVAGTLTEPGRRILALTALMAVWWLSEAIPISATALLPLVLLPLLKATTPAAAAAPYADPIIFLFLGGMLLGQGLERCGLHRRMALATILAVGPRPHTMIGGMMIATAFISMWVSNTATTVMMLPIGVSLVALVESHARAHSASPWHPRCTSNFAAAMYLGIAYAASIGGIGTPIGTPPNVVMIGFLRETRGIDISFGQWMAVAVPIMLVLLPACWVLLIVLHPIKAKSIPGGRTFIRDQFRTLGPMRWAEWATAAVFILAATGWIFAKPISGALDLEWKLSSGKSVNPLTDTTIAILCAVLLFIIPSNWKKREFLLDWTTAQKLPWGILLLFGGGLSLAEAMKNASVDVYLGTLFGQLGSLPVPLVMFLVVLGVVLAGEIAGNTALATTLMPILAAAAVALRLDTVALLFAATLAASCGFMLPVATPPNAIAYATGRITMRQMLRAGAGLDLLCALVIAGFFWLVGGAVLNYVGLTQAPAAP